FFGARRRLRCSPPGDQVARMGPDRDRGRI
ncbi:MAG: hypothetical protein AVDCRST_MAG90-2885, partial [uncultured Microvirga sp.]